MLNRDATVCERFLGAVRLIARAERVEEAKEVFGAVGELIMQSPEDEIWLKGVRLKDLLVFENTNFARLEFRISIGDQQAVDLAYQLTEKNFFGGGNQPVCGATLRPFDGNVTALRSPDRNGRCRGSIPR